MRIVNHSFTTSNPTDLLPLIQNRCRDFAQDAQTMDFLYQGVNPREYFKAEFKLNDLGLVVR